MRTLDFEFRLLRNGGEYGFLAALEDQEPTIRMRNSAEIKTSLTGLFDPIARDAFGNPVEVDWMSDEIEPVMIVDGTPYPCGIYAVAQMEPGDSETDVHLSIQAYDRCWRVRETKTETLIYFAAGTPYLTAVERLLTAAGIGTVLATPSAAVLAEDREDWEIGTSHLSVVNQLLKEINYKELYFTAEGAAVLEPVSVPRAGAARHTLDSGDYRSLVLPGMGRSTDVYNAPNVFICVCANPDKGAPLSAVSVNDSPQSPLSVTRRGRRICQRVQVDNIADQDELQAYADKLRNDSMIGGETLTLTTGLLPGWGVGDVVALHYENTIYNAYGEKISLESVDSICISRAWTMSLAVGGTMEHELERVVYHVEL